MKKIINKIKISLTTDCNLQCPYCFVEKKNKKMSLITAKKAVDLLMHSPGQEKLLSIYGGEPFLVFNLLTKIIEYARKKEGETVKKLTISVCTNLTKIKTEELDFLLKKNVKLIVSLVGLNADHNRKRFFSGGMGSYQKILANLKILFSLYPQTKTGVAFCIFPSTVDHLVQHFKHILGLGFNHFNFEIIRNFEPWNKGKITAFEKEFKKIISLTRMGLRKETYIFINPTNWALKTGRGLDLKTETCPFSYLLEVYPGGEMAFSPFLLNLENETAEKFIIGNVNDKKLKKYHSCQFDFSDIGCRRCLKNYFSSYKSDIGADRVSTVYRTFCLEWAREIMKNKKEKLFYENYLKRAKSICF